MTNYRSRGECEEIVRAVIAESNPRKLESFSLSRGEENFFRRRTARALERAGKDTCAFTEYYALPLAKPIQNLRIAAGVMIATVFIAAAILYLYLPSSVDRMPLFTGSLAVTVAAVGWVVAGGFAYRNTIRQNTNSMLYGRFAQSPINEAFYLFSKEFGYEDTDFITPKRLDDLAASDDEGKQKAAWTVGFILNYFELIANGVISGDLDHRIVQDAVRGSVIYYYDRCEPFIKQCVLEDARTYEQLRRLRAHYRSP